LEDPIADPEFDRIEPVERPQEVSIAGCENSGFVVTLIMAWSPSRRSCAGDSRFDHPGDYATFNSNHIPDRTR
ncbi:MAG TPA: hypothetical protein VNZ53_51165, partial [Steroidobacteraceae bacterium]|nr:hypothetical protein [Steroidobacteraceae bacterium]